MKIKLTYLLFSLLMIGCSGGTAGWFDTPSTFGTGTVDAISSPIGTCSPMLAWLGGICTLTGMALLVLTGGRMGWKPIIGGIIFIVINYALAQYAGWIFLPVVIATAAISLAWAGKIVWKIVNDDEIKMKEMF